MGNRLSMNTQPNTSELRSRFKALVFLAGLFILLLSATLRFAILPTDWGQKFANVALGMDALNLTFGFLMYGVMTLLFASLTLIIGGVLVIGGYRLYIDHKAST